MNERAAISILMAFASLSLFIELSALVSLKVAAVYLFGGAAILFALLAILIALITE